MQRVWYHGTNESSAHNICEHGIDFTKSKKELDFEIEFVKGLFCKIQCF